MKSYRMELRAFVLALGLAACQEAADDAETSAAGDELPEGAEAISFLGEPLYPSPASAEQARDIEVARADYDAAPDDADAIIWLGRRVGYTGAFRDAIEIFSEGIEKHPDDARMYRHRGHRWISDFGFTRAFDHRIREEGEAAAAKAGVVRTLLLWGRADADGVPVLEPAFVVDARPVLPRSQGPYTLTGAAADGETLFSLNFDMQEMADGDGESGFAFALPVSPAWADRLAAVVLSGPGGTAMLDGESGPPAAILRDPRTGRVRGIVRDLASLDGGPGGLGALAGAAVDPASLASILPDAADLEVLVSRGLPSADQWRR